MSNFNDKALKSVADAAAKIMGEALVGNQHKIDANKNGKIDGQDFKILRAKKTMKEAELDEASYSAKEARAGKDIGKPGKEFSKIAKSAGKKYGSEEAGKRVAGAVLAKLRKEEAEQIEEGGMPSSVIKHKQSLATKTPEQLHSGFKEVAGRMGKSVEHVARSTAWSHGYGKGEGKGSGHYWNKVKHLEPKSESVEQIDEYNSTGGVYKHKGKYGYQGTGAEHGVTDHEKDNDMDDLDYQKKSKKLGARQNMGKRGQSDGTKKKKTNESFTAMLEMYNEHGLKYLAELSRVEEDVLIDETPGQDIQVINADIQNGYAEMTVEEVDNETFTKEMKDQEAKMNGKKKGGDVAKASVQAVKQEEVEQIDELKKSTVASYIQKKFGKMSDEPVSKNQYGYAKKDAKGIQRAGLRMSGIKATQKEEVELDEAAPFKDLSSAVKYGSDKVKTHRDHLDGIEVYKHKDGGYDVNHSMNSNGRNSLNKSGAKHLGTIYRDTRGKVSHNIKEEVEQMDEISKETATKYLTAPLGKGANKYKVDTSKSKYPNYETMAKHATNVHRALSRSGGQAIYKKPDYYKEDEQMNEKLAADATAGDYIDDFGHSDNPKFAGKSKEERKKMALGAFYAKNKGK